MTDSTIFTAVLGIGIILISMTLHEAMHAFTSYWLGDDTAQMEGRLTLNPLKHIDPIFTVALPAMLALLGLPIFGAAKPVPFDPNRVRGGEFGAALVGLAGPLTNFVLAVVGAGLLRILQPGADSIVEVFLLLFVQVNIGFGVFNMIPFPPLDGSRVLYAFAPEPLQALMRQIEALGLTAIALFIFVLYPFMGSIINSIYSDLIRILVG